MKINIIKALCVAISITSLLFLGNCNDPAKPVNTNAVQEAVKQVGLPTTLLDTTDYYKLAGTWIKPKKSFEFNDSARLSSDTLFLVTCADYVYYPLGDIKDESKLNKSVLNGFNTTEIVKYYDGDVTKYHKVSKNNNKMLLFFSHNDGPDAYWGSYIVKGEIKDNAISLINGIRVGMPTGQFYSTFFEEFDEALQAKAQVVVLDPCVSANPKHTYRFSNGKLVSILFDCAECMGNTIDY